jgi:tRNA dimethylallyltransferase
MSLGRRIELARRIGEMARKMEFLEAGESAPEKLDAAVICVWRERDDLLARIDRRVGHMLRDGLVDEVRALRHGAWNKEGRSAVGYREVVDHVEGRLRSEDLPAAIARDTWQLARKQMMWFRSFREAAPVAAGARDGAAAIAARIVGVI